MRRHPVIVFFILCFLFLCYSFSIYLAPLHSKRAANEGNEQAANGRLVWQKYNCQSCHQLYGLGGYLGPDLTNIISNPQKGEVLIRPLITYGTLQMPAFQLSDKEMDDLLAFLKSTDASGIADPRNFIHTGMGMIDENEKR